MNQANDLCITPEQRLILPDNPEDIPAIVDLLFRNSEEIPRLEQAELEFCLNSLAELGYRRKGGIMAYSWQDAPADLLANEHLYFSVKGTTAGIAGPYCSPRLNQVPGIAFFRPV